VPHKGAEFRHEDVVVHCVADGFCQKGAVILTVEMSIMHCKLDAKQAKFTFLYAMIVKKTTRRPLPASRKPMTAPERKAAMGNAKSQYSDW